MNTTALRRSARGLFMELSTTGTSTASCCNNWVEVRKWMLLQITCSASMRTWGISPSAGGNLLLLLLRFSTAIDCCPGASSRIFAYGSRTFTRRGALKRANSASMDSKLCTISGGAKEAAWQSFVAITSSKFYAHRRCTKREKLVIVGRVEEYRKQCTKYIFKTW